MDLSQLTTVMRAYARLNPGNQLNESLLNALLRVVVPGDPQLRLVVEQRAQIPQSSPNLTRVERSTVSKQSATPASPASLADMASWQLSDTLDIEKPQGNIRGNRKAKTNLVALKSVLDLLTDEAGIVMEEPTAPRPDRDSHSTNFKLEVISPPVQDLFPESRVRAILREMAMVPTLSGRIHLETAVKRIGSGQPLSELPQQLVSTMPPAVHWLFDAGPSMLPFSRDKQQLARTAPRLLGNDRTRIADFIGSPLKGVRLRGEVKWSPMHWPGRNSVLIVVSDLGIGDIQMIRSRTETTWGAFIEEAGRQGVSLILLNPYNQDRWPNVADRFTIALAWDTAAGVQQLRRKRRLRGIH